MSSSRSLRRVSLFAFLCTAVIVVLFTSTNGGGGGSTGSTGSTSPCPLPIETCDCHSCAALLHHLGVSPAPQGSMDTCDCMQCTAVMRSLLATLGVGVGKKGSGVDSSIQSALEVFLSGRPSSSPPALAPVNARTGGSTSLVGAIGVSSSSSRSSSSSSTSSSSSSRSVYPGGNALGGRPVWTAAMAVRGLAPPACSVAAAFGATTAQCTSGAPTLSTRCIVGTHRSHYQFFQSLVKGSVEPFALLRYVDGERMILQGTQVSSSSQAGSEDKWWYEGGESQLGKDMAAGLKGHYGEPYFFAFASPADDEAGLRWYMDRTEATCGQITYANLWINNFYKDTKPFLLNLIATQGARIVLVANHEGVDKYEPCGNGGLLGCISLPDQAVTTWEDGGKKKDLLDTMFQWVDKAPPGTLFMMCGGPLSKALIAAAWDRKPTHQYVDFGSSMDEVLKGRTTRPYMREDTSYSRTIDPQWYCDPPNAIGPDGNCGTLGPNDPDLRWPTS